MQKQRNAIYKKKEWQRLRLEVLKHDKFKCQRCRGNYGKLTGTKKLTPAVLVHHHFEVEKYPDYKYMFYVYIGGEKVRNLYSLCNDCHEIIHNRRKKKKTDDKFVNDERWD